VQPTAGFELLRQYPLLRANRTDDRQRPFANGQFMLFDAGFYAKLGGHETVRAELLEDLALAREVKRHGGRAGALLGGGIVQCRMYDSWDEFKRGRILTEAAQRRSDRLRVIAWRLRMLSVLLPLLTLVLGVGSTWACLLAMEDPGWRLWWVFFPAGFTVIGLVSYMLAKAKLYRMARVPVLASLTSPVGAWLVASVLAGAAKDLESGQPTVWGGRSYHREDRARGDSALIDLREARAEGERAEKERAGTA